MGGLRKGALSLAGDSFLDRIAGQLRDYPEVLLSVDAANRYPESLLPRIVDARPGCGPLGGIVAALRACRSDTLLAVAVDMPLFDAGLGDYLKAFLGADCDAVAAEDRHGRMHPLCALYAKSALPVLEERLAAGDYRLRGALARLRTRVAPLAHSAYPDAVLANINTPEEYAALRREVEGPPIVAVSGVKNSGKTTLLAAIIPLLVRAGLKVGAVKHDAHDFVPDVPGTDSFRLRQAGAETVAVYSPSRYLVTGAWSAEEPDRLFTRMADVDVILLEGGKMSPYPKIEVVRRENGGTSVCDPSTLLALCSDCALAAPGMRAFGLDDHAGIAACILEYLGKGERIV